MGALRWGQSVNQSELGPGIDGAASLDRESWLCQVIPAVLAEA
jgi:hypothetical protein